MSDTQDKLSNALNVYKAAIPTNEYTSVINTIHRLCEYARVGNITGLKYLRNEYAIAFRYGDYDRSTPLHYAVRASQIEVVKYLLDSSIVFVNPLDRWGCTPLDYVSFNSTLEAYLLTKGGRRTLTTPLSLSPVAGGLKTFTTN